MDSPDALIAAVRLAAFAAFAAFAACELAAFWWLTGWWIAREAGAIVAGHRRGRGAR